MWKAFFRVAVVATLFVASGAAAVVRGVITDSVGTPLPGARVSAFRLESSEQRLQRLTAASVDRAVLASAETSADGSFSFETAESVVEIRIDAPGYAPKFVLLDTAIPFGGVGLTRAPERTFSVRSGGGPVAGALVILRTGDGSGGEIALRTAGDGTFRVPDPFAWASIITIMAKDRAALTMTVDRTAKKRELSFDLQNGISISGTASSAASGKPVAGAIIYADGWPAGKSSADGSFRLEHIAADVRAISAKSETLAGWIERDRARLVIAMSPFRSVSGVTRDAVTRQPIAGVRVFTSPLLIGGDQASVVSDGKGSFRFDTLPAMAAQLWATRPEYEMKSERDGSDADLRNSAAVVRELRLTRSRRVRGFVVDESGHAVGGAFVTIMPKGSPALYIYDTALMSEGTYSSPDGSFSLPASIEMGDEENGTDGELFALKRGFAAGRSKSLKVPTTQDAAPVRIVLPAGNEVSGVVADRDGNPLRDVDIGAIEEGSFDGMRIPVTMMFTQLPTAEWQRTDDSGHFTLHLNSLPHDLAFHKEGFVITSLKRVAVPAREPLRVQLERGSVLRGTVIRHDGSRVAGVTVSLSRGGDDELEDNAPDGTFSFGDLAPGRYQLAVTKIDSVLRFFTPVDVPSNDLRIDVGELTSVTGRVVDSRTRAPLQHYTISMHSAESVATDGDVARGGMMKEVDSADGVFEIADVRRGAYEVSVQSPGYVLRDLDVNVGDATRVDVELEAGVTVRGRVTGVDGAPLSDVAVQLQSTDDESRDFGTAQSDVNGDFTIEGVRTGAAKATFWKPGYARMHKIVEIAASGSRVDGVLSKGLSVRGVVQTADGLPIAGVQISASPIAMEAEYVSAESSDNGQFILEGMSKGRYKLATYKNGYERAELSDVDIEKSPRVTLTLTKQETAVVYGTVRGLPGEDLTMQLVTIDSDEGASAHGPINSNGQYRIEDAPAGHVRIYAYIGTSGSERQSRAKSLVLSAGSETQVDLELATGVTLRGTVMLNNVPVIGASLSFSSPSEYGSLSARTDERGRYELSGIDLGVYEVNVQAPNGASYQTRAVVHDSSQFDIDMTGAIVRGTVVDATNDMPLKNVSISLWRNEGDTPAGDSISDSMSDTRGRFATSGIAEGRYRVLAQKDGFAQQTKEVDLSAGAPTEIAFRLTPADGVRVRVVDGRDGHLLSANIVVRDRQKRVVANKDDVSSDGTATIPLAPGDYLLSASATGYGSVTMPITAPSNEIRVPVTPGGTVVIRSQQERFVKVRLLMPNGEEYVRCWCNGIADIYLSGPETRVENVTAGNYLVQLIDEFGVGSRKVPVTVREGETAIVNIDE